MNKKIELSISKIIILIVVIGIFSGTISYVTAGTVIDSEKVSYKDNSGLGVKNVTLVYNIDLSKHTQVMPYIYVKNFRPYSFDVYEIPPSSIGYMSSWLYAYSAEYNYLWDGSITINSSSITLATGAKSSNNAYNYYEIVALYAR